MRYRIFVLLAAGLVLGELAFRESSSGASPVSFVPAWAARPAPRPAAFAEAATLRGVVLDHETGRPLSRTRVTVQAVAGSGGEDQSVLTGRYGDFSFLSLPGGVYILTAFRPGFAPLRYGQKAWNAAAQPLTLEAGGNEYLQLRLRRLGAITGTIWDENEIGFPGVEVAAYRNTRPPRFVAKAKADDRGMFRIGLLEPGDYLVRSAAVDVPGDAGLLPTFFKEVATVEEAAPVAVHLGEETKDVSFQPNFGRVYRFRGKIVPPGPAELDLVSDMGRRQTSTDFEGNFSFEQLAPGEYELEGSASGGARAASIWERVIIDKDIEGYVVQAAYVPVMDLAVDNAQVDRRALSVVVRRKGLDGVGKPRTVTKWPTSLSPGRWEFHVKPPPGYWVSGLDGPLVDRVGQRGDPSGWNELVLRGWYRETFRVKLSPRPASLQGRVTGPGSSPSVGAPVFVERFDPETGKRLVDLLVSRTDVQGRFAFPELPPGRYRVLSTFDLEDPTEEQMAAARPKLVSVGEGDDVTEELSLFVLP